MTPRAEKRQAIEAQILDVGRTQLATVGAAALSLRAIARELGMVSSAIYRYVASRDELLTQLVVEAYGELAQAVDAAVATETAPPNRLHALAHEFRRWAVEHPEQFALLYGSPVPGYHAPAEQTVEPGTRVIRLLLEILVDAEVAAWRGGDVGPELSGDLTRIRDDLNIPLPDDAFVFAVTVWTWLIGSIGQEVFGGFGADTFTDPSVIFDAQLRQLLATLT